MDNSFGLYVYFFIIIFLNFSAILSLPFKGICSNIRLTDGSGVSKNNLVTADFMTQYLVQTLKIYDYNKLTRLLPTSGEGTLSSRMPLLKDKIHAKTGTLSNISGIGAHTAKDIVDVRKDGFTSL